MPPEQDLPAKPPPELDSLLAHLRRLTVTERLALNDAAMRAALELRRAFAARGAPATMTPPVTLATTTPADGKAPGANR